jgi:hypothetical protein
MVSKTERGEGVSPQRVLTPNIVVLAEVKWLFSPQPSPAKHIKATSWGNDAGARAQSRQLEVQV